MMPAWDLDSNWRLRERFPLARDAEAFIPGVVDHDWDAPRIRACLQNTLQRMDYAGLNLLQVEGLPNQHRYAGDLRYSVSFRDVMDDMLHELAVLNPQYEFNLGKSSMDLSPILERVPRPGVDIKK